MANVTITELFRGTTAIAELKRNLRETILCDVRAIGLAVDADLEWTELGDGYQIKLDDGEYVLWLPSEHYITANRDYLDGVRETLEDIENFAFDLPGILAFASSVMTERRTKLENVRDLLKRSA